MIHSDAELVVNLELIAGMYRAVADLHRRIGPINRVNYQIMAEGPMERIRRLRKEINDYLGVEEPPADDSHVLTASSDAPPAFASPADASSVAPPSENRV
jgi:hypothetical protein